jgi:hypothetical protein
MHFYASWPLGSRAPVSVLPFLLKNKTLQPGRKFLIVRQALVSRQFVQDFFHGKIVFHDVTDLKPEIRIISVSKRYDNLSTHVNKQLRGKKSSRLIYWILSGTRTNVLSHLKFIATPEESLSKTDGELFRFPLGLFQQGHLRNNVMGMVWLMITKFA